AIPRRSRRRCRCGPTTSPERPTRPAPAFAPSPTPAWDTSSSRCRRPTTGPCSARTDTTCCRRCAGEEGAARMDQMLRRTFHPLVAEVLPAPTPLDRAVPLGERLGRVVFLKREDLTPVFSFKLRGAYNAMAALDETQRRAGVIASSAGNHAQGVAAGAS